MIKIDNGSDCGVCVCVGNLLHLILNVRVCAREVIICT